MTENNSEKPHSFVRGETNTLELANLGHAINLRVYHKGRMQGRMLVGHGAIGWIPRGWVKAKRKTIPWDVFAVMMKEWPFGSRAGARLKFVDGGLRWRPPGKRGAGREVSWAEFTARMETPMTKELEAEVGMAKKLILEEQKKARLRERAWREKKEAARLGHAINLGVYRKGRMQGRLLVGRGAIGWIPRGWVKAKRKTIPWDVFAVMMKEWPFGSRAEARLKFVDGGLRWRPLGKRGAGREVSWAEFTARMETPMTKELEAEVGMAKKLILEEQKKARRREHAPRKKKEAARLRALAEKKEREAARPQARAEKRKEEEKRRERGAGPVRIDDARFTVYRPRFVPPKTWHTLLVFAHRAGPFTPERSDPAIELQRQAEALLGEAASSYQVLAEDSAQAIPSEGRISLIPDVEGLQFNPRSRTFRWTEEIHREEFRFVAEPWLDGRTARGRLTVFWGAIVLAEITLAIKVSSAAARQPEAQPAVTTSPYRKIFASYSRLDLPIVRQFRSFAKTLGDRYLLDLVDIRTGEVWTERIAALIRKADVFQLFWSDNSMRSAYVRQEWEYALALHRRSFVRPTYWEEPLPRLPERNLPPPELKRLQFQRFTPPSEAAQLHERADRKRREAARLQARAEKKLAEEAKARVAKEEEEKEAEQARIAKQKEEKKEQARIAKQEEEKEAARQQEIARQEEEKAEQARQREIARQQAEAAREARRRKLVLKKAEKKAEPILIAGLREAFGDMAYVSCPVDNGDILRLKRPPGRGPNGKIDVSLNDKPAGWIDARDCYWPAWTDRQRIERMVADLRSFVANPEAAIEHAWKGENRCVICSYKLRVELSKELGIGPKCRKKYGSVAALKAELARRADARRRAAKSPNEGPGKAAARRAALSDPETQG